MLINLNILTKRLLPVTCLLVFMLFFLSTGHEFMHNHEPDHEEHGDCPAHQIDYLFNSLIIPVIFFTITLLFLQFIKPRGYQVIDVAIYRDIDARAPPLT
jgi:TRAP-type C4-dicarboxylate transport system permease small subunit